ncbi:hypothetical protein ACOTHZ_14410 [Achromobacter xylosoxidans]
MHVSNSTLSGPSGPLGFNYSSTRFTTDANGEARFTEVMGSAKQKYIESSPASKAVTLSDKAVALSSQETEDEDADLSLLACWTPEALARFANNYTEAERYQKLEIMVFNSAYTPGHDCSELTSEGGPIYYGTTRILVTPEREAALKRQHDTFAAQQEALYVTEMSKGSSAMDIYKKIGKLILAQPDDFAYKFGISVKYRERMDALTAAYNSAHNSQFGRHVDHSSSSMPLSNESKVDALVKAKTGLAHNSVLQKASDLERQRQQILMDLLHGKAGFRSKSASSHRV